MRVGELLEHFSGRVDKIVGRIVIGIADFDGDAPERVVAIVDEGKKRILPVDAGFDVVVHRAGVARVRALSCVVPTAGRPFEGARSRLDQAVHQRRIVGLRGLEEHDEVVHHARIIGALLIVEPEVFGLEGLERALDVGAVVLSFLVFGHDDCSVG